jgi:Predicted membrane protein (DUF2142)
MTGWLANLRRYGGKSAVLACFILCALPVGLLTALITPPGQAPDEPNHTARAAGLLHWAVVGERRNDIDPNTGKLEWRAGIKVDAGLVKAAQVPVTNIANRTVMTTDDFLALRAQRPDHHKIIPNLPNTATYSPVAYIPAALGLALGQAVKAPPFACFLLARLFMLAAYLTLGALALSIAAYGEASLLVVLIMPMSVFLAGTVTQDSVLIALACLACAAMTRGTPGYRFLGLAAFVLFLGGKPPYILMLGAFLLPLAGAKFRRRACEVAIACLPVLLWVALISAFVVVPFDKQLYHPGPLYTGNRGVWMDHVDTAANLHILLSPPSRLLTLPWHTWQYTGIQRLREMVGVLGALQIVLPDSYYRAWGFCGAAALLGLLFQRRPVAVSPFMQVINFLVIGTLMLVTVWLLMIMFYLNWSNAGLDWIDGMQGRYFLPLLPFLLLAVPGFRWRFTLPPLLPALPAVALGIYDIGYIPMKLV